MNDEQVAAEVLKKLQKQGEEGYQKRCYIWHGSLNEVLLDGNVDLVDLVSFIRNFEEEES